MHNKNIAAARGPLKLLLLEWGVREGDLPGCPGDFHRNPRETRRAYASGRLGVAREVGQALFLRLIGRFSYPRSATRTFGLVVTEPAQVLIANRTAIDRKCQHKRGEKYPKPNVTNHEPRLSVG